MPDPHSTAFIPERTFSPLTQNFKNPLQAKMAASTYANAHNVVASVQRNHLAVVPKQVMIRVNDTLAKQSFEKISDYLNHGMDDCQGDNCHPRLRVTGQISPTTFVATVERDPVSPNPSTPSGSNNVGPSAGELQANAMKMVCDTLPHCPGVTAIEADVIFPVLSDIPTSADMITLQQNENTPSDPLRPKQWGLDSPDQFGIGTDAAKAFQKSRGYPTPREAGIHIGVGDTGCGVHPDMEEIFLPGRRFDRSNYPADDAIDRTTSVSHGVHVAGTAGAITGNNIGIEGVTDAKILPAKVLSDQGSGSLVDIILGIRWMAGLDIDGRTRTSTPARVINLSLGYEDACSQFLQDTINEATEKGVVVVVAAGNSNIDAGRDCPSNCRNVITVGAHDPAGKRAEFSNFGPIVDVYAPGVNILAPTHRKVKTPPPSEKPNRPDHRSPNSPNSPNSPQNPNIEPPKDENQSGEAKKKPWWLLHNT
jgi:subtilisin family serine protease